MILILLWFVNTMRKKRNGRISRPTMPRNTHKNIKSVRKYVLRNKPEIVMNNEIFRYNMEVLSREDNRNGFTHRLYNIMFSLSILHMLSNIGVLWELISDGKLNFII